jgi:hypothetical protein
MSGNVLIDLAVVVVLAIAGYFLRHYQGTGNPALDDLVAKLRKLFEAKPRDEREETVIQARKAVIAAVLARHDPTTPSANGYHKEATPKEKQDS